MIASAAGKRLGIQIELVAEQVQVITGRWF
jgi:hypothetical protein